MSSISGTAAASGHITLLFSIHDEHTDPLKQGSRGIGLCIDGQGAATTTTVHGVAGAGKVTTSASEQSTPLFSAVVSAVAEFHPIILDYDWKVEQSCSLPQQQGFGLSAAGALASAHAFQRALGIEEAEARAISFHVAHLVERELSGGLGDVAALWAGGVVIRKQPGCPETGSSLGGSGVVQGWYEPLEILVAWRDRATRHTSSYIDDEEWKRLISKSGNEEIEPFLLQNWDSSCWADIAAAATEFADQSRLSSDAGRSDLLRVATSAIQQTSCDATPHLCMLGESIVILPTDLATPVSRSEFEEISRILTDSGLQCSRAYLSENTLR